ncbi:MAG: amidinotransferase [Acidimicrobiia bacterium]|nr:amidinotransferase [Acidimicrobiia bacterium]
MPLSWGRRYLMCPPEHFGVLYEINPWMHREVLVDADAARQQWENLKATLEQAGAHVEVLPPARDLPDLVFTANAGVVNGSQFVPSRFMHPERRGEVPHYVAWFEERGFTVDWLPDHVHHEGAGDALPFGSVLLSGYRFRSDAASHAYLSRLTGAAVRSVELADERLYHLDLTFCPLDERRAMVAPEGWDRYGRRVVEALVPELLVLDTDQTLAFCANSVVVNSTVVMPSCPPPVGRQLEACGFDVVVCNVDEFLKAGGACRCLTLALDVTLGPQGAR